MSRSKIAEKLEVIVNTAGRGVGTFQVGVNKILWGRANTQPASNIVYNPATGSNTLPSLTYSNIAPTVPATAQESKIKNFAQSGLYNILNALNSVDLCSVITYAYDNVNVRKKPRPEKPWNKFQTIFFSLQDRCKVVTSYIDKYTALPNTFITSFSVSGSLDIAPNLFRPTDFSGEPLQGGVDVVKYNTYFLFQNIKAALNPGTGTGSLLTPEDAEVIRAVPGLINNLNFLNDKVEGIADRYTSYVDIADAEIPQLTENINKIRATCITIQNLNLGSSKELINQTANYLGVDIRNEIQQLNKYVDVTKIIPTLKQVNDSLRSFIRIANQAQRIITTGQFIIKLCLLLFKVFRFLLEFFKKLPIPSLFGTYGTAATFQDVVSTAKDESNGIVRVLRALNALLGVVLEFIKYLLANTVELLRRLEVLLTVLRGCEAMKDSDVLFQLEETNKELLALKDQLEAYVLNFEGKTDPNLSQFGDYQIRVLEEEVLEVGIVNRRRRGVALDRNGVLAAQSDLTFATNTTVIIEEVKQKLVSLGLVNPTVAAISPVDLQVFSQAYNYLDNNDILDNDISISEEEIESADNLDESKGLGLQAFVNNLKGGRRLRQRTRSRLVAQKRELAVQLQREDPSSSITQGLANQQLAEANKLEIQNLQDKIDGWKKEIAVAYATISPTSTVIIADRTKKISAARDRIRQLGG